MASNLYLATIRQNGLDALALSDGMFVYPAKELSSLVGLNDFPEDMVGLMERWQELRPMLDVLMQTAAEQMGGSGILVEEADLRIPLQYPGKILCAGANYYDHLKEMGLEDTSKENQRLFFFFKPPRSTMVGHGGTASIPARSGQYDWEIELAVVFGKRVRNASLNDALESVAAVSVAIDLSARDRNAAPNTFYKTDWVAGKANDQSCPFGPWLVPIDQIENIQNIRMRLSVNNEIKQDARTSGMIFSVAEQIVELSSIMTLDPGDVLLTGTPAGVGKPKGTFLKPGDQLRAEIEGIGELQVTMA